MLTVNANCFISLHTHQETSYCTREGLDESKSHIEI